MYHYLYYRIRSSTIFLGVLDLDLIVDNFHSSYARVSYSHSQYGALTIDLFIASTIPFCPRQSQERFQLYQEHVLCHSNRVPVSISSVLSSRIHVASDMPGTLDSASANGNLPRNASWRCVEADVLNIVFGHLHQSESEFESVLTRDDCVGLTLTS